MYPSDDDRLRTLFSFLGNPQTSPFTEKCCAVTTVQTQDPCLEALELVGMSAWLPAPSGLVVGCLRAFSHCWLGLNTDATVARLGWSPAGEASGGLVVNISDTVRSQLGEATPFRE